LACVNVDYIRTCWHASKST